MYTIWDMIDPSNSDVEISYNSDDEDYIPDLDYEIDDDYSSDEQHWQQHQTRKHKNGPQTLSFHFKCGAMADPLLGSSDSECDGRDYTISLAVPENTCLEDEEDNTLYTIHVADHTQSTVIKQEPFTTVDEPFHHKQLLEEPAWTQNNFQPPDVSFKGHLESLANGFSMKTPHEYFKELVTDTMLESIVLESNKYALASNVAPASKEETLKTTAAEIKTFIGLYLRMGLVRAPCVRAYWADDTRCEWIAEVMPRNRFVTLARNIRFVENDKVSEDERTADKLWKIRPWIDEFQRNLGKIPSEEYNTIGEIMIPFKSKSIRRQHLSGKPNPLGFKLWVRTGRSGILYQFEMYQGDHADTDTEKLGVEGSVVMRLISNLEDNNHELQNFYGSFFTSLDLLKILKEKSMWFLGNVSVNRLKGCNLNMKSEMQLKKTGSGSWDHRTDVDSNAVVVRWYDNKAVDILSSYVGLEPVTEVDRWDQKTSKMIKMSCPKIIQEHDKFIGGVDHFDSLCALYKFHIRTKRWHMKIFYHLITAAVVTSWLWYRRHCHLLKEKAMKLSDFQVKVAATLIGESQQIDLILSPLHQTPSSKKIRCTFIPDDRLDGYGHLPKWVAKRPRCKNGDCDGFSYVMCAKCKINLCLNKDGNCFTAFHTKK